MSNEKNKLSIAESSSAPASMNDAAFNNCDIRPPPPTYEESQRMYAAASNHGASNQIPAPYIQSYNYNAASSYMQSYGATAPPPQYYQHVTATAPPTFNNVHNPHVVSLAPGAKIRTTTGGAVTIPPPPPGCAPTAAQFAAMQGQPVILKKTKPSFF